MHPFFRNIGVAIVFFLSGASIHAATIQGTYDFGGTSVEFMAEPCTNTEVVANLKFWDHQVSDYQRAVIGYPENNTLKTIEACYAEMNGQVDLHWSSADYFVLDLSNGTLL
ncbi:MAG: hypothetical protein MN733_31795 [Nitrososphaera sp.]|nr:hypothetical protein [Nitrososphaera sp.]